MHVIFDESSTLHEERKLDDDDVIGLEPSSSEQSTNEKTNEENGVQL